MSDTLDPNDKPDRSAGDRFWSGSLFGENTSPYVKDALSNLPEGKTHEEYSAENQPIILPMSAGNRPPEDDPDAPSNAEDEMDKALKEMLGGDEPKDEKQDDASNEDEEVTEVDCPSCSGSGRVPVSEARVEHGPEAPNDEQRKKLANRAWDKDQEDWQRELQRLKDEYAPDGDKGTEE